MTIMHYRDYEARVEYDEEAELFHGEITNLRDVVTFQGRSVEELKQALADSVDDYLDYCKERGEAPDEPVSGELFLHIAPQLHRAVAAAARRSGHSINAWAANALEHEVAAEGLDPERRNRSDQAASERTS